MTDFYLLEDEIPIDYIKHVLNLAQQQGLDIDALLQRAELDFNPLAADYQHIKKLPAQHYEKLCRCVQHSLKNFSFCDTRLVDSFEMLCYCLQSAGTLGEAIRRTEKYINLTQLNAQPMSSSSNGGVFCFSYVNVHTEWDDIAPLQLDAHILFFWHRLFNWLINDYITLDHVEICGAEQSGQTASGGLFNCPLQWGSTANTLYFSDTYLEREITRSPEAFSKLLHHSEYNFFLITDSHVMPVAKQVQVLLDRHYPGQFPALDSIAQQLHMSSSSLRRRLKRENSSYQGIKDRLHMQRAVILLQQQDLSISHIAEVMEFNDSSCFQRAFKRWAGSTPGAYRQNLQSS